MSTKDAKSFLLEKYGRSVVHMRQQIHSQRFGLVFGAGASKRFGFPDWTELIDGIASHEEVRGEDLIRNSRGNTSASQLLFQFYRSKRLKEAKPEDWAYNKIELSIHADWLKIVRDVLYAKVPRSDSPEDQKELSDRDIYLEAFLGVIRDTPLTINYNFDNTLQRMLDIHRPSTQEKGRGYTTIWSTNVHIMPRKGVIYHPNGYLPHVSNQRPSEQLIFLEDSFADQLMDTIAGHYAVLSYHLSQATRLFIGLSLSDSTLKHQLRQHASLYPGNYHYYIAYVKDRAAHDEQAASAIEDANFEVYNLITLFLTDDEIKALGELLVMEKRDFKHLAEEVGVDVCFKYLVTGSVAVGKSTSVSSFHTLNRYDEWHGPGPPGMEKDPTLATKDELQRIDRWVIEQLNLKNLDMKDAGEGIHLVDRAPLDAFAFTEPEDWKEKARAIRKGISPGQSKRKLSGSHLVFLYGDPNVMAARALAKWKQTDEKKLERQQNILRSVYCENSCEGISIVDARDKTIRQVVKEVGNIIFRVKYTEAPMHDWLERIEAGDKVHPDLVKEEKYE